MEGAEHMLKKIRDKLAELATHRDEDRAEGGFTLIELMVVVLIIAILIAIAIPTFLGARQRAQNRAAQSNLRNALTAEKTHYTDGEAYTDDTGVMGGIEPSLQWNAGAGSQGTVGVYVGGANDSIVCVETTSASETQYAIKDIATGAGAGTFYLSSGGCGGAADTAGLSWASEFS